MALISFLVYSGTCLAGGTRAKSWLSIGLALILAGLSCGLTASGAFIASGMGNRVVGWGIGFGIFGMLWFLLLWVQHGLVIPRMLRFLGHVQKICKYDQ